MVKKLDSEIIRVIEKYVEVLKKHYSIDSVYLFGSFAKGNNHEDSDIDVAIISNDIKGKFGERVPFMMISSEIDLRIEPHPINTEDYKNNATALINEIRKNGIQLYVA